jgi:hypothetical protein
MITKMTSKKNYDLQNPFTLAYGNTKTSSIAHSSGTPKVLGTATRAQVCGYVHQLLLSFAVLPRAASRAGCCCCCFGGVAYQHCSHEGLLYSHPNGVPSFIPRGAAHKRRERPLLAKDGTMAKEFS